jgi:hypothetical protein
MKLVPELSKIEDKIYNYIAIRDQSKYEYLNCQIQYIKKYNNFYDINNNKETNDSIDSNYDPDQIELEADIAYYYNRFYMALQMCGVATSVANYIQTDIYRFYCIDKEYLNIQQTDGGKYYIDELHKINSDNVATSSYSWIVDNLYNKYDKNIPDNNYGLNGKMQQLEQKNKALWDKLYIEYADFIYEASYENTDELNCVSLYNQATSYFENYHHPKSNYSIEIINLEDLEEIGVPNLRINSRIRVYNKDLGLEEGETYNGDEDTRLNNVSYTNNELLITSLNYTLRQSAVVSITVEQVFQHQTILQKLIKNIK